MLNKEAGTGSGGARLKRAPLVIVTLLILGGYVVWDRAIAPQSTDVVAVEAVEQTALAQDVGSDAQVDAAAPDSTSEKQATPPAAEQEAEAETVAETPDTAAPDAEEPPVAERTEAAQDVAPRVDEVRLEGDGLTVIAGRAAAGAQVTVFVDGQEIATAIADARGSFAAVGFVVPSNSARVLTLLSESDGTAIPSDGEVILAPVPSQVAEAAPLDDGQASATPKTAQAEEPPSEPAEPTTQSNDVVASAPLPPSTSLTEQQDPTSEQAAASNEAAPQAIEPLAAETASVEPVTDAGAGDDASSAPRAAADDGNESSHDQTLAGDDAVTSAPTASSVATQARVPDTPLANATTPVQAAADETTTAPDEPQAVAILRSDSQGVELVQPTQEPTETVGIDTIGYTADGDVRLSGQAAPGTSEVRVYLDNRFVASFPVERDGGWRGAVRDVAAGLYQLRVDAVNGAGDVTSRLETPFQREAPALLAEASTGQDGPVRSVTVQTGDTLWAIARERYGEGVLFVKVFEANQRDIRDPDLIYPGQVFDLPVE